MDNQKHIAMVMAAGEGTRVGGDKPKQFLELAGNPLLYYSLKVFEDSFLDEIVVVTNEGMEDYCRKEIIEKYGFQKVTQIIAGGRERCDSVYRGLHAMDHVSGYDYVYIQDGARPFVDAEILERARQCVLETNACAAGMPVKDTIKVVDDRDFVFETPDRRRVWQIQTPQVFSYAVARDAYDKLYEGLDFEGITDDAMVVEQMLYHPVKLFRGSYRNFKITTPEDLALAEQMMKSG